MAAAASEVAPTFNWTGMGRPEGPHIHYQSFNFAGQHYTLGDCVYLLPEEEGSPPYIARLVRAYEDTNAKEAERLVIEVQWFERRGSLPPSVGATMHEAEVVESDLIDTNLVGCLDSKATIVTANSYDEALQLIPPGHTGDWHFCRGVWDSERQCFKSYADMGVGAWPQGAGFGQGAAAAMYQQYQQAALNGYGELTEQDYMMEDDTADLTPRAGGGRARGGRSRRTTAARSSAAAVNAAAAAAAVAASSAGGYQRPGIPGKVCCECGATQTPQWREGPKGPKTLCNACGVRYQRQQSKAKSNKRGAADRGGKERGSSPAPHGGGRGSKHARLSAASAGNTPDAAAAAAAAMDDAFSAAAVDNHLQQLQMAQLLNGTGGAPDPAAAAAIAAPAPAHHHGTRRNAKHAAAAAAAATDGRSPFGPRSKKGGGGSHSSADAAGAGGGRSGGKGAGGKGADGGAADAAGKQHKGHGHPALAAAVAAAAGEQLGYYADERSPPNSNTRILEYDDEEANQQHAQQQHMQGLARSNTHEAADALQNMANSSQQQEQANHTQQRQEQQGDAQQHDGEQQQQQTQPLHQQVSAAATTTSGFFSALGSPATALLIAEQGMPSDSMPLLSLDDKYRPGTPSGLGVTDGLDGINTHSLSPLKPHAQQLLSGSAAAAAAAAAAVSGGLSLGRDGSTTSMPRYGGMGMSGPGAVCASPGRLISAMVQNLKLPAPLALNPGLSPLGAVTTLGMPTGNLSQQQQHQQHPSMLSDLLAGTGASVGDSSGSRQQQHTGESNGTGAQQHLGMDGAVPADGSDNGLLTQLRSLLFRASSYTPDVSGLSGLYPGPSTPRSLKQLMDQLESLPDSDKAQVQQVSAAIEDSLSKAKAAEAAVLAVTQVLATKQSAAAEAKADVERTVLQLRTVLNQINPAVAAAAAGNGGNGGYHSNAATPTAADAAAASNGMQVMTTGTTGFLGQGYPLTNGAGGMLGLAEGVGRPYGPAAAIAQGPMNMTDTDDLLRDPDDVPPAAAAAANGVSAQQPQPAQVKTEPAAAGDGAQGGVDQQVHDMQQQQEGAVAQQQEANGQAAPVAPASAAQAAQLGAPAAAESAPVAA